MVTIRPAHAEVPYCQRTTDFVRARKILDETKTLRKPTTKLLRSASSENKVLTAKRHEYVQKLLPDIHLPTPEDETADPNRADEAYATSVRLLIERARDQKKFPLVFEENCNYGFRRNLWGMRPLAIALAVGCFLAGAAVIGYHQHAGASISPVSCGAVVSVLGLLSFWVFWCDQNWVRLPAEAFAERLLATAMTAEPRLQGAEDAAHAQETSSGRVCIRNLSKPLNIFIYISFEMCV